MNKEILMELEILRQKMEKTRVELFNNLEYNIHRDISFAELIFAITNKITRSELLKMSDLEFIEHIQKIQILES